MEEIFKDIPPLSDGIKPYYKISTQGRVINHISGKEIIPHFNDHGYLQVSLMTETGRVFRKVHRLMMLTFCYFEGCESYQVNHKDGNKTKNYLYNLEWATPKENIKHAIQNNLRSSFIGDQNPMASITNNDAREIGLMIIAGIPDRDIANQKCDGNISIVRNIAYGNTWSNVFTEEEKMAIALTRRGNALSTNERHAICAFYQENHTKYTGYGSVSSIVRDSLISIDKDPNDIKIFRIAKRLYYRYESDEITSLYIY